MRAFIAINVPEFVMMGSRSFRAYCKLASISLRGGSSTLSRWYSGYPAMSGFFGIWLSPMRRLVSFYSISNLFFLIHLDASLLKHFVCLWRTVVERTKPIVQRDGAVGIIHLE